MDSAPLLASHPTATGGIARLAAERAREVGIDVASLWRRAKLDPAELEDGNARIPVQKQVAFLHLAAIALGDDLLGFHLAEVFDLRQIGLLYYVMSSAQSVEDALARAERYSAIANEGFVVRCLRSTNLHIRLSYVGVPRHSDRHQLEFWVTALVRAVRHLTQRDLRPVHIALAHARNASSDRLGAFFGCPVEFGSETDEVVLAGVALELPLPGSDPYLHTILSRYCEEMLARRPRRAELLRPRVENQLALLLPHGRGTMGCVAQALGMSQRSLARRLAEQGLTFTTVLDELRKDLAEGYLQDPSLSVSQVAWLLGFAEVSSFTNAFRRWTGNTPRAFRSRGSSG